MPKIADRIEVDPVVHHGKPVVAGTRVPVHMILELLGSGVTFEEIIKDYYDGITKEDVLACIRYANSLVEEEERAERQTRQPGETGAPTLWNGVRGE